MQRSLRERHELEARGRLADEREAAEAERLACLRPERDRLASVLRGAAEDARRCEAGLRAEEAGRDGLLQEIHLARGRASRLSVGAAVAASARAALQAEVEGLRAAAAAKARRELQLEALRAASVRRLLRRALGGLAAAARLGLAGRGLRQACRARTLQACGASVLAAWRSLVRAAAAARELRAAADWQVAAGALLAWACLAADSRWLARRSGPADAACRRRLLAGTMEAWHAAVRATAAWRRAAVGGRQALGALLWWRERSVTARYAAALLRRQVPRHRRRLLCRAWQAWVPVPHRGRRLAHWWQRLGASLRRSAAVTEAAAPVPRPPRGGRAEGGACEPRPSAPVATEDRALGAVENESHEVVENEISDACCPRDCERGYENAGCHEGGSPGCHTDGVDDNVHPRCGHLGAWRNRRQQGDVDHDSLDHQRGQSETVDHQHGRTETNHDHGASKSHSHIQTQT